MPNTGLPPEWSSRRSAKTLASDPVTFRLDSGTTIAAGPSDPKTPSRASRFDAQKGYAAALTGRLKGDLNLLPAHQRLVGTRDFLVALRRIIGCKPRPKKRSGTFFWHVALRGRAPVPERVQPGAEEIWQGQEEAA
jgi:hypothetical protein